MTAWGACSSIPSVSTTHTLRLCSLRGARSIAAISKTCLLNSSLSQSLRPQSTPNARIRCSVSALKNSVPDSGPETGSMSAWGATSFDPDCHHHPVLPKPQIPAPPLNRPFLWGFSLVSFRSFRLWRHFAVSQPDFSHASLHPKIPFPASGFSTARSRSAARNFRGIEAKNDVSNRSIIIAVSIQGLRTVGSILPEHHEVARLQYRAANGLRPRRGRDLVRGRRARSSC